MHVYEGPIADEPWACSLINLQTGIKRYRVTATLYGGDFPDIPLASTSVTFLTPL